MYLLVCNLPFFKDELIENNNNYFLKISDKIEKYLISNRNQFYERNGKAYKNSQKSYYLSEVFEKLKI